jgi:hypothetical protein
MLLRMEGNVARMGEIRSEYKIFIWKPEGKRALGRRRRRWWRIILKCVRKIGLEGVDWVLLGQARKR